MPHHSDRESSRVAGLESRLANAEERLAEANEVLRAIRSGEVDALVVGGADGDQVFTLQGAETPYRILIEEMNEGALLLSPEGTILYANARFAKLAEVPLEEVVGSLWKRFFSPADLPRLLALLSASSTGGVRSEFNLCGGNGSVRAVLISLRSMTPKRVEGYSVVITDLTERKAAEEAVNLVNHELEHFSYSITHDMRAPLRAIQGFISIIEEESEGCESVQRHYLDRIRAAATRMDILIRDSLDYAKAVRQEVPLAPVELAPLLRGLVESYPNLQPDKANIEISPNLPRVMGDEAALTQCFANLLDNAVKFVAPGTKPKVRVWAQDREQGTAGSGTTDSWVRIWFEDNGIGIPQSFQPRLFDMFQRASKDYEGTGIGLAIVRKVVQRIGGSVGVESGPDNGSRFWVELRKAPHKSEVS